VPVIDIGAGHRPVRSHRLVRGIIREPETAQRRHIASRVIAEAAGAFHTIRMRRKPVGSDKGECVDHWRGRNLQVFLEVLVVVYMSS